MRTMLLKITKMYPVSSFAANMETKGEVINPFKVDGFKCHDGFSGENKATVTRHLEDLNANPNPLEQLEDWVHHSHYTKREVGFCAQWCLDNLCEYHTTPREKWASVPSGAWTTCLGVTITHHTRLWCPMMMSFRTEQTALP